MNKQLVFLEFIEDLDFFLKFYNNEIENSIFIALAPDVLYELEKRGVVYDIPENFCDYDILRSYYKKWSKNIHLFCDILDDIIQHKKKEFFKENLTVANIYIYYFKMLIDPVVIKTLKIISVINELKCNTVKCFNYCIEKTNIDLINNIFFCDIIKNVSEQKQININILKSNHLEDKKTTSIFLSKTDLKKKLYVLIFNCINFFRNKKKILYCENSINRKLYKKLLKAGFRLYYFNINNNEYNNKYSNKNIEDLINSLENNKEIKNLFIVKGINIFSVIKKNIEFFLQELNFFYDIYGKISEKVKKCDIILCDSFSLGAGIEYPMLGYCGNKYNKKNVLFQHGASGIVKNNWWGSITDFNFADIFFVTGEYPQKYFLKYKENSRKIDFPVSGFIV